MHISSRSEGHRHVWISALLALAFVVAVVVIWQRNRDILRDLYDYSTVITAAGKIEAGLRPYTDVRSPMQTSVYYFNWLTEQVFGANYLALTWGGLVQALGGGLLLAWMLRRSFGISGAVLLAGAVMLAGLIQHVVFFYNPIGIVCFGLVVTGLAARPQLWPVCSLETVLIYVALFIGGTNKLNYQGLAIAVGGLLLVRAWTVGKLSAAQCWLNAGLLLVAGLVLPIAFELWWTGASLHQWLDEVVLSPAERYEATKQAFDARILLRPVHDFHHHLLFRPIGGLGLVLLTGVGTWALWRRPTGWRNWLDLALRVALLLICAVGSALLMVTNYETVMLTSLAFLLSALALFLAFRRPEVAGDRRVGRAIVGCSLVWSFCGGYAAWHGSRVLFAQNPPPRSDYVRIEHASRPLAYLEGVRFPRVMFDSLQALASRVQDFEHGPGGMRGMLFAPGLEWLERAYPEAIVHGMPIWYDRGTSLSESDGPWFDRLLRQGDVSRIVSDATWELWPRVLERSLAENYRTERVGGRYVIYHPRQPRGMKPVAVSPGVPSQEKFRVAAESNVLMSATLPGGGMTLQDGPTGGFFGASSGSEWFWPLGPAVIQGTAIAVLDGSPGIPGQVTFRIFDGPSESAELLWETPVHWQQGRRFAEIPFRIMPLGRPLSFEVQMSDDLRIHATAGWRQLRITQAGSLQQYPELPISSGLQRQPEPAEEGAVRRFASPGTEFTPDGWGAAPVEFWHRQTTGFAKLQVRSILEPGSLTADSRVMVTLAWYRAGRFEIVTRRTIDARSESQVILEGGVPEADGWIGVMVSPLTPGPDAPRVRIQSWQVRPSGIARAN